MGAGDAQAAAFSFLVPLVFAAAATPALGQAVARTVGPASSGTQGAASIPDFSGIWGHLAGPGAAGTFQASNALTPSVLREATTTHERYVSSHDIKAWIAEASEERLYRDGEPTWNKAETSEEAWSRRACAEKAPWDRFATLSRKTGRTLNTMTKPLPFTESRVRRAIAAVRKAGLEVSAVSVSPDGTVTVYQGEVGVASPPLCRNMARCPNGRTLTDDLLGRGASLSESGNRPTWESAAIRAPTRSPYSDSRTAWHARIRQSLYGSRGAARWFRPRRLSADRQGLLAC
jgi:hypothetical protein